MSILVIGSFFLGIFLLNKTILVSLAIALFSSLIAGIFQDIYIRKFAKRQFEVREDEFGTESLAAPLKKKSILYGNLIGTVIFITTFICCSIFY